MAVRYDFSRVADPEAIGLGDDHIADDFQHQINQGMILLAMAVAMGSITESNWTEFYARATFLQRLVGPILVGPDGQEYHLTAQDVHRRIGFKVNVSDEPRHTWAARKVKRHLQDWMVEATEAVAVR